MSRSVSNLCSDDRIEGGADRAAAVGRDIWLSFPSWP